MRTTIDARGRVVIPKQLREQTGMKPGTEVDIRLEDGRIVVEALYLPVRLVREGILTVAVPEIPVEPLTAEIVEQTRQAILDERTGMFLSPETDCPTDSQPAPE